MANRPLTPLAQQRRGVRHAAHDWLLTQPAVHAGAGDAGGNRHHQLVGRKAWAQGFAHGLHGLRLDRQHHHISPEDGLGVVGEHFDTVFGLDPRAGLGTGIAGANQRGVQALGTQAPIRLAAMLPAPMKVIRFLLLLMTDP